MWEAGRGGGLFFLFNTPAERLIEGQLIRGNPRDYIKAKKEKNYKQSIDSWERVGGDGESQSR